MSDRNDPIVVEIIANRLQEIQRLMKQRLFRTGYSTILRESFDGSSGLTTADGRLVGSSGMALHTAPYARFVQEILKSFGSDIHEGDTIISNDPFKGGVAHTPDLAAACPVFHDGQLVAFCTSMGHKSDVGGIAPSTASSRARSIFHEGLLIPPVKLYERGEANDGLVRLIANNSRTPQILLGDIEGQVGCMRVGASLFQVLCAEYSAEVVGHAMEALMRSAETRLRAGLRALPDGEVETFRYLDNDGAGDAPVRIHLRLTKKADQLRLDFSASDPQCAGPSNTVEQSAQASAIAAVVAFVDHKVPLNDGVLRAIDFDAGSHRVVSPRWPTAVNSYVPGGQLVFSCVMQALGQLLPSKAYADSGLGVGGIGFGFAKSASEGSSVHYDVLGTSLGGTARQDGASLLFPPMVFETVQPIEVVETEFPLRVREFSIRTDSAGPGQHRGGLGFVKEWEVLEDCELVSRLSGRKYTATGAAGGSAPPPGQTVVNRGTAEERRLEALASVSLKAGDVVRIEQSGGAGWGDPTQRAHAALWQDVEDGYVSVLAASAQYGFDAAAGGGVPS